MKKIFLLPLIAILCIPSFAQQIADTLYAPPIHYPAYEKGKGSSVFIDEGHHNFHTKDGRYASFAKLLERDGYRVNAYQGAFEEKKLKEVDILVISNALHEKNVENWFLPTYSAFTTAEIDKVEQWVNNGGSLFLIADHMPMAGAAHELAKAFGFECTNGFVFPTEGRSSPAFFSTTTGTLAQGPITAGRNKEEAVTEVATFTGQAFTLPPGAQPLLTFPSGFVNKLPDTAWVFTEKTTEMDPEGWSQGAFMDYGKGKVVMFGEAAMFSAQLAGPQRRKMGMNNPVAAQNYQLLLNIIHWLDGLL